MKVVLGLGRWMLHAAVEAVSPAVGGCAGFVVGQVAGPQAGGVAGRGVRCALDYFGKRIADLWLDRFRDKSPAERQAAVEELAAMAPGEARREISEAIEKLAPDASPADKALAVDYLAAIPQTVARSLVREPGTDRRTMPARMAFDDPRTFLQMLPVDVPPYPAPCELPGTSYRLEELVGVGGFGAVYRAVDPKLPYLSLAIKFCLDPSMHAALKQERGNLERLIQAGGEAWSPRVVRLYGCDLEHPTPYLVYEYAPGGDLARFVTDAVATGNRPSPAQVRQWVTAIAEGLAFAHRHGLVHRDLKPANVLLGPGMGSTALGMEPLKIADFGIGGPVASRAIQQSRIGTISANMLTLGEQAALLRGSGTPLYMSPEQRRGDAPDPRHDVYSLGVMWYQLLLGDCGREFHPGWADELAEENVPSEQAELIRRCVGMFKKRPVDAGELLAALRGDTPPAFPQKPARAPEPAAPPREPSRQLFQQVVVVRELHKRIEEASEITIPTRIGSVALGLVTWVASCGAIMMLGTGLTGGFSRRYDAFGNFIPFAVIGGMIGAFFIARAVVRRYQTNRLREQVAPFQRQLDVEVDLLASTFPEEVRAWGGRDVLYGPVDVEKIYRRMEMQLGAGR